MNYSWSGVAAERYSEACQPQADAAGAIKKAADDTRVALGLVIGAGLAFYVAIGVVVAQWIGAMGASTAAVASVVAAPAGAAAAAADSGVSAAAITAAVVALTAVVVAQANAFGAITAAMDQSKFGAGDWPDSVEGHFSDGTVHDGRQRVVGATTTERWPARCLVRGSGLSARGVDGSPGGTLDVTAGSGHAGGHEKHRGHRIRCASAV